MIAARIGKVLIVIRLHLQGSDARAEFPNLLKNVVADRSRWELAGGLQQLRGHRFQVLHLFSVSIGRFDRGHFPCAISNQLWRDLPLTGNSLSVERSSRFSVPC